MDNTTRNPVLVFQFAGMFLFRIVHRAFLDVLFQEPPRTTRGTVGPALVLSLETGTHHLGTSSLDADLIHPPSKRPTSFTIRAVWPY